MANESCSCAMVLAADGRMDDERRRMRRAAGLRWGTRGIDLRQSLLGHVCIFNYRGYS